MRLQHVIVVAAALLAVAPPARALQHLVAPGEDWSRLIEKIKPGDEIILMPGRHRPAHFGGLTGTADKPIVIRGYNQANPGLIVADRYGLYLQRPRFVQLRDLVITGARENGINVDDQDGSGVIGDPWSAELLFKRVTVMRTGPDGNTDGIKLSGLRNVRINECRIEGWGGSAIDMVGCHDVSIENCVFKGSDDGGEASGVQAKGGSRDIRIRRCRFDNAGRRGVNVGGSTELRFFRPPVPDDAEPGTRYEAERIIVEHCQFIGGDCALAFVGARDSTVRNCTIVDPRRWVFRILQETTDPRFGPCRGGTFGSNLVLWQGADFRGLVNVGPNTEPQAFNFEANLWWTPGLDAELVESLPGELHFPQTIDIDPELDESLRPRVDAARNFGASLD